VCHALGDPRAADLNGPCIHRARPVVTAVRTMFLTSRAAARHMIRQGSGVIMAFGGYGDPLPGYYLGGLQVAFQAIEALRRNWPASLDHMAFAS
jgi:hypothetical protein